MTPSDFFPDVWNIFHDGTVERIVGEVPGSVELFIDIEYLRERFSEPGECFVIRLEGCSLLSFNPYEGESRTSLSEIEQIAPDILSAERDGDRCKVFGDAGVLLVRAESGSLRLDAGTELSLQQLKDVASDYWDDWSRKDK